MRFAYKLKKKTENATISEKFVNIRRIATPIRPSPNFSQNLDAVCQLNHWTSFKSSKSPSIFELCETKRVCPKILPLLHGYSKENVYPHVTCYPRNTFYLSCTVSELCAKMYTSGQKKIACLDHTHQWYFLTLQQFIAELLDLMNALWTSFFFYRNI